MYGTIVYKGVDGCAFPQSNLDVLEEENEEIEQDYKENEPEDHDELDDIDSESSESDSCKDDATVNEDSDD